MRVLAMQQPLAAQQILGKTLGMPKQVDFADFPTILQIFNISWICNGKWQDLLVKQSYD